jgi:hypothetical protein
MLFATVEPDQAGPQGAALVGLGAGEALSEHGGRKDADLVDAIGQGLDPDGAAANDQRLTPRARTAERTIGNEMSARRASGGMWIDRNTEHP